MKKSYHTAADLRHALDVFEEYYDMDSEEFMRAHRIDAPEIDYVPRVDRNTWSSYYAEWRDLTAGRRV